MKRGQEEMVGFVLIMVIVAVVLLVLLGISIRSGERSALDSIEATHFLESVMQYTTSCELGFGNAYGDVSEVLRACSDNQACFDGRESCRVLNETIATLVTEGWTIGPEGRFTGYSWESTYYTSDDTLDTPLLTIMGGTCEGATRGATYTTPAFPGRVRTTFTVCT